MAAFQNAQPRLVGETRHAAGMVEVEMRQHDVAHVGGLETEPLDLAQRSIRLLQPDPIRDVKTRLSRRGCAMSRNPNPVSTRTSPTSVSISRQWQTIVAAARSGLEPSQSQPPKG